MRRLDKFEMETIIGELVDLLNFYVDLVSRTTILKMLKRAVADRGLESHFQGMFDIYLYSIL